MERQIYRGGGRRRESPGSGDKIKISCGTGLAKGKYRGMQRMPLYRKTVKLTLLPLRSGGAIYPGFF
jgi:hypothetical protein